MGLEPTTFRLVAYCLHHYATAWNIQQSEREVDKPWFQSEGAIGSPLADLGLGSILAAPRLVPAETLQKQLCRGSGGR
jgi:hypothetical protein